MTVHLFCDMHCPCEECEDMKFCDIYYEEYQEQLEAERLEEEWKEQEYAKKEMQ